MEAINRISVCILLSIGLYSCGRNSTSLFQQLDPVKTGVAFENLNAESDSLNILDYLYFYNGAGVAAGDINNDGLTDLYFVSNQGANKLYLNHGNWNFEDITAKAGVEGNADWSTGVVMADVNDDGFLDIYVSTVSDHQPEGSLKVFFPNGRNQLFINNHDGTFTERAREFGLDLRGYNTQAVFFDYDRDGDLDMFQLQHSIHRTDTYGDTSVRRNYSGVSGGKLLRNDNRHFVDVTRSTGIYSSVLGYGLGVIVTDFNNDGWEDFYVGNDFHENDYYYVNQRDGSFKEMNSIAFGHQSNFSMGNDAGDINHDGWPDLVTLDMLPADEKVLKSSAGDESFDTYMRQRLMGYNYQYSRNALQLNTGRGMRFSEQALMSGIAATDWSWSVLLNDYDLDGQQDLFVTNGIRRRLNDLDYIKFLSTRETPGNDQELLGRQPDGSWHNYLFSGTDSLLFSDRSVEWGFEDRQLSNGAVYADLDNDGDPDLVTNNMNSPAGLYKNQSRELRPANHFLRIKLDGSSPNRYAIGAKAIVFAGGQKYFQELQTVRGFMSSVEPVLTIGLGSANHVDSIYVLWPGQQLSRMNNIPVDSIITIHQSGAATMQQVEYLWKHDPAMSIHDVTQASRLAFTHKENLGFVDFNRQMLIPHELSTAGPAMAVGDVNNDGLDDIYFGGAKRQPGELWLQLQSGQFTQSPQPTLWADSASEDVDALFVDVNNDGFKDLYVVSGGNEYFGNMAPLLDRLYINDGTGHFTKRTLPPMYENKSVVAEADFDEDGDVDLFVGGRADSKSYGKMPLSFLLVNDGKGNFEDATERLSSGLRHVGMVTGASWTDVNLDGRVDLVITGEWMSPVIYSYKNGRFTRQQNTFLDGLTGWWSCLRVKDIDKDGDPDLLLGNYGLNNKFTASKEYPLKLYVADMDNNGTTDQLLAVARDKIYRPFLSKEVLERQLPGLKKKFLTYGEMAGLSFDQIFSNIPKDVGVLTASTLSSMLLINDGHGQFSERRLPREVQLAPVFDFFLDDLNRDSYPDLIAGGNFYGVTPYEGRYDALLLCPFPGTKSGIFGHQVYEAVTNAIRGEVRRVLPITISGRRAFVVGRNNMPALLLEY